MEDGAAADVGAAAANDDQEIQLIERLQSLKDARIEKSSRYNYLRGAIRFIRWLYDNKPICLTDSFLSGIGEGGLTEDYIKSKIEVPVDISQPPIKFSELSATTFLMYIITIKKSDGSDPSSSTLSTYRSALWNLFKDFGVTMDPKFAEELSLHFSGQYCVGFEYS